MTHKPKSLRHLPVDGVALIENTVERDQCDISPLAGSYFASTLVAAAGNGAGLALASLLGIHTIIWPGSRLAQA